MKTIGETKKTKVFTNLSLRPHTSLALDPWPGLLETLVFFFGFPMVFTSLWLDLPGQGGVGPQAEVGENFGFKAPR